MPLYEFRCPDGDTTEAQYLMAEVPDAIDCPTCGHRAGRRTSSPRLSRAGSSAYRLIESTSRSAHEPEVVSSLPTSGRPVRQQYTSNPLHTKLPRP